MSRRDEYLLAAKRRVDQERFGANRKTKSAVLRPIAFANVLDKKARYKKYLTATGKEIFIHPDKDVKKDHAGQPYLQMGDQRISLYV